MQNTLSFNNAGDITFVPSGQELKIFVSGSLLGAFNASFPATLFVSVNGSAKTITFKQISNGVYTQGNTNTPGVDTLYYNFNQGGAGTRIDACNSSGSCFKMSGIGWEDDDQGQSCTGGGGKGFTNLFNITSEGQLKVKVEQVSINGVMQTRLVARYSGNVMCKQTPATAYCCNDAYCYFCNE